MSYLDYYYYPHLYKYQQIFDKRFTYNIDMMAKI